MEKHTFKVKSISYNAIMNSILSISSILFPLITFPYICRTIGVETYGQLTFAESVVSYFTLFATLGLTTYGIKACAQVRDDRLQLSVVVKELLAINSVTTIISYAALLVAIFLVPRFKENTILLLIYSINMILNVSGLNWLYTAIEQYDYITARSIIFKMISLILLFLFVQDAGDKYIYAAIMVFGIAGANICNIIYARHYINFKARITDIKRHIKPTITFFASSLASNVYSSLDTTMLGFINGNYEVGIYSAAVKIKRVLITLVVSIGNVLLPRMSYYISKNDMVSFKRTLKKSYGYLICIAAPVAVYFIIEAKASVLLLSGTEYLDAIGPMQILMPILITTCLANITGLQILMPLGKEKIYMYAVMAGAVCNLFLNLLLMPNYGAVGASIATLLAECIQLVVQLWYVRDYAREFVDWEVTGKVIISVIIGGMIAFALKAAAILPLFSIKSVEGRAFVELVAVAIVFFGVYGLCLIGMRCSVFVELTDKIIKRSRRERK